MFQPSDKFSVITSHNRVVGSVRSSLKDKIEELIRQYPEDPPQDYVEIIVADESVGIVPRPFIRDIVETMILGVIAMPDSVVKFKMAKSPYYKM